MSSSPSEEEEQELKKKPKHPWNHLGSWQSRGNSLFFSFFLLHYLQYVHRIVLIYNHHGPAVQPQWAPNGTGQNLPKLDPSDRTV